MARVYHFGILKATVLSYNYVSRQALPRPQPALAGRKNPAKNRPKQFHSSFISPPECRIRRDPRETVARPFTVPFWYGKSFNSSRSLRE